MRINKFIAHATNMSRREADNTIAAGRVQIDGHRADMGAQATPESVVKLDGVVVGEKTEYTYVLLNKPVGFLCSRRSQGGVPTIYALLPERYRSLKAVGRLDKDSSGLILLTDDGDFAFQMTHPSFHKVKIYEVALNKPLTPLHQQMISDYGVTLEDGVSQFLVEKRGAEIGVKAQSITTGTMRSTSRQTSFRGRGETSEFTSEASGGAGPSYTVTMHEGRNRQIRRTFTALGYTVTRLHRTNFGNYALGDIPSRNHIRININ